MFEQQRYEFILEALQPIAHHEGTIGNESFIMRTDVRQSDGKFKSVPIITGDTLRHKLREASTYALLGAAGILGEGGLTEEALRLLFAGGMITGSSGGSVKLDAYRELCELVPPLAILGGCAQNRCIPGRLRVSEALLICEETKHIIPSWVLEHLHATGLELANARGHIESVQRVRMDPTLDPLKQKLLTESAQGQVNKRLQLRERASEEDDNKAKALTKSTNMPRRIERLKVGSLFYWDVTATLTTELERDTFNTMTLTFLSNAYVGGKSGTGHGRIRAITVRQNVLARPQDAADDLNLKTLAPQVGIIFKRHVQDRADRIREFLAKVEA